MVKMVRIEKSAADRRADTKTGAATPSAIADGDSGISVHLDHHHLMKMGIGGMKSGQKVELSGRGTVERSETRSTPEGDRHSATIHLTHAGADYEGSKEDERDDLRGEIAKNAGKD